MKDGAATVMLLLACLCADAPALLAALVLIAAVLIGAKEYRSWRCNSKSGKAK